MSTHQRVARLQLRALDRARTKCNHAHFNRRAIRADWWVSYRRHLRLHGWIDRRVEQSDLRRRYSVYRAVRVGTDTRRLADYGHPARARRVRTLHHRDRL